MKEIKRIDGESDEAYEARKAEARQKYLERRRAYYAAHAEESRAACREYRKKHLDQIKARERKFYREVVKSRKIKCNLKQRDSETDEEFETRVELYKEKCRQSHKKWLAKNKEKVKATAKRYWDAHKDRLSVMHKEYIKKHRAELSEKAKRRWDEQKEMRLSESPKLVRRPLTKEEKRVRALQRYYANREKISEQRKARYRRNREHELAKGKEYRAKHAAFVKSLCDKWREGFEESSRKAVADWFSEKLQKRIDASKVYGVVYLVANVCTNRFYVGQARNLKARYCSGLTSFIKDARERNTSKVIDDYETYGIESFSGPELVAVAYSKEELDFLEAHYIKVYDSFNTGYNQTTGNIKSVARKIKKGVIQ